MFKNLLSIVLIISAVNASAMEDISPELIQYNILYDSINPNVPEGKTLVKGNVYAPGGELMSDALVSTADFRIQTTTDSLGYFELEIDDTDSCIFAYKLNFTEVIIPNYDFKSQHEVVVSFYLRVHQVIEMNLKPVVYCYGDIEHVKVAYEFITGLTFSYPQYKDSWEFSASTDGVINYDGVEYPYLFWEGENLNSDYSNAGENSYLVKTDTIVQHFDNLLTSMNLNAREKTDFITFWGPKISQKEYAILQFLNGKEYDEMIAEIRVNPAPNSMLRFYLLFTPLDYPIPNYSTQAPIFKPVQREGFTLIEWGGSEIPLQNSWLKI